MSAAALEQPPEDLWNYERAAQFLGVAVKTLQMWVSRKQIGCIRLSPKTVVFDPAELRQFVNARRIPADGGAR